MKRSIYHKVYIDEDSNNALKIFDARNEMLIMEEMDDADMLWMRHGYREMYENMLHNQLLNHIPNEGLMTRKGDLTEILHTYGEKSAGAVFSYKDFYKETYRLYDMHQRQAFIDQLPDIDKEENLWIMKPSTLSRGIGIKILWQFNKLKKQLKDTSKMTIRHDDEELEYIIQRYITDVLLLNERKSEIRVYWSILSIDPLRVVIYPEGTVRLTTQKFKLGDYDNPLIHVANVYQQKMHKDYDPDAILKWNFPVLDEYISKDCGLAEAGWLERDLMPKIKRCLEYVARAVQHHLIEGKPKEGIFFGLFGADFILDKNLTPWLAEIQKGPGLSYSDPMKKEIIPPMLNEAVDMAFEVQDMVEAGESLQDLEARKKFEWIINEW
jgi:tubulin--tyrosine ligase like protein 10